MITLASAPLYYIGFITPLDLSGYFFKLMLKCQILSFRVGSIFLDGCSEASQDVIEAVTRLSQL